MCKKIKRFLNYLFEHLDIIIVPILFLSLVYLGYIKTDIFVYINTWFEDIKNDISTFVSIFISVAFTLYLTFPTQYNLKKVLGHLYQNLMKLLEKNIIFSLIYLVLILSGINTTLTTIIKLSLATTLFLNFILLLRIAFLSRKNDEKSVSLDEKLIKLERKIDNIESYTRITYDSITKSPK